MSVFTVKPPESPATSKTAFKVFSWLAPTILAYFSPSVSKGCWFDMLPHIPKFAQGGLTSQKVLSTFFAFANTSSSFRALIEGKQSAVINSSKISMT